ncbi:MAG: translation initiation factor IF-3 [Betaproteobacteria bacterium TMED82]|nr:MAG: translation initiation factor IF-3 [Betaproteobacteria bacterium TMED82]
MVNDKEYRINEEISSSQVRLLGVNNESLGIVSSTEALKLAEKADVDLVEIAPQADPVVCRLMDFGKFRYQRQKRAHDAKQKQKVIQLKEVKFRPSTEDNDYNVKVKNIIRFLEEGDKTKVTMRFKGREIAHQEFGMQMLERIKDDLEEFALVEQMPKLEGKQMVMVLAPKKKK